MSENLVDFSTKPTFGYAFGMVIRHGFTENWSCRRRNQLCEAKLSFERLQIKELALLRKVTLGSLVTKCPVLALLYVRLADKLYMNAAFGLSLDFYPSDVAGVYDQFPETAQDSIILRQESVRRSWIQVAGLANLGWEYRTEESGYFYLGGSFHRPFNPMYISSMRYSDPALYAQTNSVLNSSYITLDFRYFFHEDPVKKQKKVKKPNKVKEYKKMIKDREKAKKSSE